jgi:hypothetical protein
MSGGQSCVPKDKELAQGVVVVEPTLPSSQVLIRISPKVHALKERPHVYL